MRFLQFGAGISVALHHLLSLELSCQFSTPRFFGFLFHPRNKLERQLSADMGFDFINGEQLAWLAETGHQLLRLHASAAATRRSSTVSSNLLPSMRTSLIIARIASHLSGSGALPVPALSRIVTDVARGRAPQISADEIARVVAARWDVGGAAA